MEPVLIIGLGGIGAKIAAATRRRMEQDAALKRELGEGIIQFLLLDTATECWASEMVQYYEPLAHGFYAGPSVTTLKKNAPFFQDAWPAGYQPEYVIREGGQVRLHGRLSLFEQLINRRPSGFMLRLNQAYKKALDYWNMPAHADAKVRVLRVILCGSGAGGTCSGTLIDVAFAIRSFIERKGGIEPEIFAFLLDHEAVRLLDRTKVMGGKIEANHAACLLELEYWCNREWGDKAANPAARYDVMYPAGGDFATLNCQTDDARAAAPVNWVYHIGATFEDGSVLNADDYAPLAELAAEGIYTLCRVATENFAPLEGLGPGPNGMSQIHGSFGGITLRVPVERIEEHVAARVARRVLARALGDPTEAAQGADARAEGIVRALKLRELDQDEVVMRLREPRPDTPVVAPPDLAATVEQFEEETWATHLDAWLTQYDTWRNQFAAEAARNAEALIAAARLGLAQEFLSEAGQRSLGHARALSESLAKELQRHRADVLDQQRGVGAFRARLRKDGNLGEDRLDLRRGDVRRAYDRLFHKGLDDATTALRQFLEERMATEAKLILHEQALGVYEALLKDVSPTEAGSWWSAVAWTQRQAEQALQQLAAGAGASPLAARLSYTHPPRGDQLRPELHVLGSADVVDEVLLPRVYPTADDPAELDDRKAALLAAPDGLVEGIRRARQAATVGGPAWADLQTEADRGAVAAAIARAAKAAVLQKLTPFFKKELTLDAALALEADYIVDRRQDAWPQILGEEGAKAVRGALGAAGLAGAKEQVLRLRLQNLRHKAMLAAQRAHYVENVGGAPLIDRPVLSGDPTANPTAWRFMREIPDLTPDDRKEEHDHAWRMKLVFTHYAFGVELWWLASFHKALDDYNAWRQNYRTNQFPLHTDARYGREWPFELPGTAAADDAVIAFYVLYAYGLIQKAAAAGHFKLLPRSNREKGESLGRGAADVITTLRDNAALTQRCQEILKEVQKATQAEGYPSLRWLALLDRALGLAREEETLAAGGSYQRQATHNAERLTQHLEKVEQSLSRKLEQERRWLAEANKRSGDLPPVRFAEQV